ncbi:MAG: hypothetical protein ACTTHL_01050 [Oribacterium sp.]
MAGGFDGSLKFDTKIITEGFTNGISTLSRAAKSFQSKMSSVGESVNSVFNKSSRVMSLERQISQAEAKAEQLRTEIIRLGETKIPTEEYQWYTKQIDAAEKKLTALQERQDKLSAQKVSENSARWKSLQYDIEQAILKLKTYKNEQAQLEGSGQAFTSGTGSEDYQNKVSSLRSLSEKIAVYRQRLKEVNSKQEKTAGGISRIAAAAKTGFGTAAKAVTAFGKRIAAVSGQVKRVVSQMRGLGKTSGGVGKSILKLSGMFKLLLLRMAMRAAIQGVQDGFKNLVQYSAEANNTISGLVASMTYLKNSFAAAFAPILSFVTPVLNTLIGLLATAVGLINQFFAALGGASTFIRAKKVNEDYAKSLKKTGGAAKQAGKDAEKALAPFDDLVQIQQKESSSGGGNGGGADPANMFETVGIDQGISDFAKKIKELFNAGDWEGIGRLLGEKINESVAKFTEYISWDRIGGKITYFVTAFTTMFNSGVATIDWYAIGVMMGTGINTMVNTLFLLLTQIDWYALGRKLGTSLNGMAATIDWEKFGATIGAFFQAKISGLLGFVTKVDWEAIGKAISKSLTGMIRQINWEQVGLLLARSFNAVFLMLENAALTFDWKEFGTNIATSLSTLFQTFDWSIAGDALSLFVTGLLDFLIIIVQETDWSAFVQNIVDFIAAVDWIGLAEKIFTLFYSALGTAFGMLAQLLGRLIAIGVTAAKNYFDGKIEEAGGNVALGILKGILDGFVGIAEWIINHIYLPFWNGILKAFGIQGPESIKLKELGKFLWNGFCKGIEAFFSNPAAFIQEKITGPFVNAMKTLLGIHSPSKVLEEIGGYTVEGFNQGVAGKKSASQGVVQSWAKGIGDWFASKLGISGGNSTEAQKWAGDTISGFNSGVNTNYTKSQSVMETWSGNIRKWFVASGDSKGINKESWTKFALDIITAFKDKIAGSHTETQGPMELWAENLRKWFLAEGEGKGINAPSWTSFAADIIKAFADKIKQSHNETQAPVQNWAKDVLLWFWGDGNTEGTGGLYDKFYKMAKRINEGFAKGISDFAHLAKDAIRRWAREAMEAAEEEFDIHSPSREFHTIAEYVVKGFNEGISDMARTSQREAEAWLSGVIDVFRGVNIGVPVGLSIPNAGSYIPAFARGTIAPRRAGDIESLREGQRYGSSDLPGSLMEKIDALMDRLQSGGDKPTEITLYLEGSLSGLARILKPELDQEAKRRGVNLVVIGGQ